MVELLINNVLIPVKGNISTDLGANDLGSLATRTGEVSASFEIDATPTNMAAFDGVFNRRITAKVINNGTIQSTGYVLVSERSIKAKEITLDYFGEVSDLSSLLGDTTLRDLDWSDLNHIKTPSSVMDSFSNTEGYIYPLIDYNNVTERESLSFNANDFYPAVYLKTIVEKILNSISYTLNGSILNDYFFNRAIVQYIPSLSSANTISNTYGQVNYGFYSEGYTSGYIATDYIDLGLEGPANLKRVDIGGNFDFPNDRYIVPRDGTVKIWGYFRIDNNKPLVVKKNGVTYASLTRILNQANFILFYVPCVEGDYIQVENFVNGITTNVVYDVRLEMSTFDNTGTVEMKDYIEDLSCGDVLNFILTYYCGIISVNPISRILTINKINDIVNNIPSAYDWTSKIDRSREIKIKYNKFNSDYGQSTVFLHKEPSEDIFIESYKENLSGILKIENNTLPKESEFYESPFSPVVYDKGKDIFLSRIYRYKLGETISYNAATTSDGRLRLNTSSAHNLSIGDFIQINTSSYSYLGIQKVIDVFNSTSVVVNETYIGADTGTFIKIDEVKEVNSRLMIYESLQDTINFTQLDVEIDGILTSQIPFVYSNLDSPSVDNSGGQKKVFATWSKVKLKIDGIEIDGTYSNGLLDEYWSDASTMLALGESYEAYLHLDSVDIKDFDYSIPIYIQDTSSYYYLSSVENYNYKKGIYLCKLIRLR